jgi:hypothetical protein
MAHRVGVCGSCRSRFQIPATFAHDRARCRTCGGVVEIGPLEGAPDPAPVAAPVVAPVVAAAARAPIPAAPVPAPAAAPVVPPEPAPTPNRRSPLVPWLVGGLILAALAIGAWRLID